MMVERTLGEVVKARRLAIGLSQGELAADVGLRQRSRSTGAR